MTAGGGISYSLFIRPAPPPPPIAQAASATILSIRSHYGPTAPLMGTSLLALGQKIDGEEAGLSFDIAEANPGEDASALFEMLKAGETDAVWLNPAMLASIDPALALFGTPPFGMQPLETMGWFDQGGGRDLMIAAFQEHGVRPIVCAVFPGRATGWHRREIRRIEDYKGLRIRSNGLAANALQRIGAEVKALPGGEVFLSLQKASIDAASLGLPSIDLDYGLQEVAKHYYVRGWQQATTVLLLLVNAERWESLSLRARYAIEASCNQQMRESLVDAESRQAEALRLLQERGAQLHASLPEPVLTALEKAWTQAAREIAADNKSFANIYAAYQDYRARQTVWRALAGR